MAPRAAAAKIAAGSFTRTRTNLLRLGWWDEPMIASIPGRRSERFPRSGGRALEDQRLPEQSMVGRDQSHPGGARHRENVLGAVHVELERVAAEPAPSAAEADRGAVPPCVPRKHHAEAPPGVAGSDRDERVHVGIAAHDAIEGDEVRERQL